MIYPNQVAVFVYGQMNEPPKITRVALSGLSMAEYFRDEMGQDVLLFVDNIFRFSQAGSEVSALLGRLHPLLDINQLYRRKWVFYRKELHLPRKVL